MFRATERNIYFYLLLFIYLLFRPGTERAPVPRVTVIVHINCCLQHVEGVDIYLWPEKINHQEKSNKKHVCDIIRLKPALKCQRLEEAVYSTSSKFQAFDEELIKN